MNYKVELLRSKLRLMQSQKESRRLAEICDELTKNIIEIPFQIGKQLDELAEKAVH